jgi:hypothetical protein
MDGAAGFPSSTYWIAVAAMSLVLVAGFRLLVKELQKPIDSNNVNGQTVLQQALSEKPSPAPGGGTAPTEPSFSRVAGAIGALGIAAAFVGIGYWILHALFFVKSDLANIDGLRTYFLAGAAMFLPYAFNQLASIFKS